ncbi:hypothetical protein GOY14_00515 [Wolbachia endosymbiont of Dipetalonema caudispina]|uniref:hypothetical protein n=1 Tax=Wolbachia endosymbiont of Dipetalonema caudispina TaxID=1812112 RepID=UPI00158C27C7|nr:hypothetical protein [Wolbachia endosymbiont of Dipetalonema caudispina]QKX00850.1 hypothetical protein GOY14_00515 [Wolbachia endosymbiont of Dipetalonema caudispina]
MEKVTVTLYKARILPSNIWNTKHRARISAAAFIDWEGDKTFIGAEIGEGLEWEWQEGVIDNNISAKKKKNLLNFLKYMLAVKKVLVDLDL